MRDCLAPLPPRSPETVLPEGAVDTHCHIIGPVTRYPLAEGRTYTPQDAPVSSYLKLRRTLGIDRSVIVQPGAHGFDNRVTVDAVTKIGETARGIVVVPPETPLETLSEMNDNGIRGLRLSTLLRGGSSMEGLPDLARKIEPLGWHILFHLKEANELVDLAPLLRDCPVPVVLDHMARTRGSDGVDSAHFRALINLLETTDHCWTKICSWYRLSNTADHSDVAKLAQKVIAARPDRVLWGSNWPHPLLFEPPMPDDAELVDEFASWAGPELSRILVDNPVQLYGF